MLLSFEQWKQKITESDSQTGEDESEKFELERNILANWEEDRNKLLRDLEDCKELLFRRIKELTEENRKLKNKHRQMVL